MSDASFKAKHIVEKFAEWRSDPVFGRVEAVEGWEKSPIQGETRLDAIQTDLLERAYRAANGLLPTPATEFTSFNASKDADDDFMEGGKVYSLKFSEPGLSDRGLWTLSTKTAEGTIGMITSATVTRDLVSGLVEVRVSRGERKEGENLLETGEQGSRVEIVLEIFGGNSSSEEIWKASPVVKA